MNYGMRFVTLYRRQGSNHPHGKEMQKSKMAVWGGLTNSCEKKRSWNQDCWRTIINFRYTGEGEGECEVAQSCPTLCDPMDCSLPCSSVHGIFQARVLEWGAIAFSRGSSQPGDRTWVSRIVGRCSYRLSHQGSPYN